MLLIRSIYDIAGIERQRAFGTPERVLITASLNDMDFDQLETFLEVARLCSFSRAAEKRFRTQPAVSSQIRALEEEVGARLLDRSGGKVSLTASG